MRRVLTFAVFVACGVAVGYAYDRRGAKPGERLDVYFDDGSFVTYVEGSTAANRLLPLARQILTVAAA